MHELPFIFHKRLMVSDLIYQSSVCDSHGFAKGRITHTTAISANISNTNSDVEDIYGVGSRTKYTKSLEP